MKRIAIITSHHEPNYGNKLQNYALQTVISKLGCKVETINDARSYLDLISWKAQRHNIFKYLLHWHCSYSNVKHAKFFFWSKRYIKYSSINIHSDADVNGLEQKYDIFVVGSDQIWNPEWKIFSNYFGFAAFAKKEQKVAYAPSLGVSQMIPEREVEYRKYLKDWKALSCREESGAKIIESLTGEKVPVVVDPTLLLKSSEWSEISSKRLIAESYILLYTLRPVNKQVEDEIRKLSDENKIKIISLNDGKYSGSGPSEFLSLIKYADVVVTDSFHGSVFALHFHRRLIVCDLTQEGEKSKMSRLQSLFDVAGIPTGNFPKVCNSFFQINWKLCDKNIEKSRTFSLEYLSRNLLS